MREIERFERFAAAARQGRELAAFGRATKTLNDADDVLEPRTAEAERVVAALEAMFLVLSSCDEGEAGPRFRRVLRSVMAELDEERADELVDALGESLEEEGLDIRLKGVGEALGDARPFAEQTYKLCLAIASLAEPEPGELDELMLGLAEELGLEEGRVDCLRALVDSALREEAAPPKPLKARRRKEQEA